MKLQHLNTHMTTQNPDLPDDDDEDCSDADAGEGGRNCDTGT